MKDINEILDGSEQKEFNRRNFIKATASTGITAIAGCNSGGSTTPQTTNKKRDGKTTTEESATPTSKNTAETNPEPLIEKGKELRYFINPKHLVEDNAIKIGEPHPYQYTTEEQAKNLIWVPFMPYRSAQSQQALTDEQVEYLNQDAVPVTGRFNSFDWKDERIKITHGFGELGTIDLDLPPQTIEDRLSQEFTEEDVGQNRKTYTGTFIDQRDFPGEPTEQEYEVIIGQRGSNLVWAADRPDDAIMKPFLDDLYTGYMVMENTVDGDSPPLIEDPDSYGAKIMRAVKDVSLGVHNGVGMSVYPQTKEDKDKVGVFAAGEWGEDEIKVKRGEVIRENGEYLAQRTSDDSIKMDEELMDLLECSHTTEQYY
jgi:hypothetical protein